MRVPQMRAYILDGPRPAAWRAHDPGYWVAVDAWAPPTARAFSVDAAGRLTDGAGLGPAKRSSIPRSTPAPPRASGSPSSPMPRWPATSVPTTPAR